MSVLDKLIGQLLVEVACEEGNTGMRFSAAGLGVYAPIEGPPLDGLVGQSVTAVRHVDGQYMEIRFSRGDALRVNLTREVQPGPESYCLTFDGGPMIVG